MATLISMEYTPKEAKEQVQPSTEDAPKYPWGLQVSLDDDSLQKLGITTMPEVGTQVVIIAKAYVTSVSASEREGGDSYRCLDLQITEMQMEGAEKDSLGRALTALYGDKS